MPSDLITLIREKQAAIAKLQAELDEAKQLLVSGAFVPSSAQVFTPTVTADYVEPADTPQNTSTAMAEAVVRDHGRQMHVKDMLRAIKSRYGRDVKRDTLVGNISRLIKAGKTFKRTAPNTFDLIDRQSEEPKRMFA